MLKIAEHILWDSESLTGYIGIPRSAKEPKSWANLWVSYLDKRKAGSFLIREPQVLDSNIYKWEIQISKSSYCPHLLEVLATLKINSYPTQYDELFYREFPEFKTNLLPPEMVIKKQPQVKYQIKVNMRRVWEGSDDYDAEVEKWKHDRKSTFISVTKVDEKGLYHPILMLKKKGDQWL